MKPRKYVSSEDLEQFQALYAAGLSTWQIAEALGFNQSTVNRWLLKLGTKMRAPGRIWGKWLSESEPPDACCWEKQWLSQQYWDLRRPILEIATECKISKAGMQKRFKKLGIKMRSRGEATRLREQHHIEISSGLSEILSGGLLGDGSLTWSCGDKRSAHYVHGDKHRIFLSWLASQLRHNGLSLGTKIALRFLTRKDKKGFKHKYAFFILDTHSYPEFGDLKRKWYPGGKKHVPSDLLLTPVSVLLWWIGDGSLKKGRSYQAIFCTDAFDKSSIEILRKQLYQAGIETTLQPASNRISVRSRSLASFYNYIGPCPEPIKEAYGYKWPKEFR